MTLAICVRCGDEKLGAFTPCRGCGAAPESAEERAKALLLSDRSVPADQLRAIAAEIREGRAHAFDSDTVASLAAQIEAVPPEGPLGCRIFMWGLIAVLVLLALLVAILFYKFGVAA